MVSGVLPAVSMVAGPSVAAVTAYQMVGVFEGRMPGSPGSGVAPASVPFDRARAARQHLGGGEVVVGRSVERPVQVDQSLLAAHAVDHDRVRRARHRVEADLALL